VLAQCSNLTQLQHAEMGGLGMQPFEPMSLQYLPASLTQLTVHDALFGSRRCDAGSSSSGQLSALLKLELSQVCVRPLASNLFVQMLSMCPQLQVLVCNLDWSAIDNAD
jgi:hypothetical protein